MAGPLFVLVDWGKVGTFVATGDDVTDRIRSAIVCTFGRDQSSALAPLVAGSGSFDLDNSSKDYSRLNSSSPLFGKVKPARPVMVQRTVSSTTYTIFRGHTDDQPLNPDVDAKLVTLNLVDYLADFRGITITTPLYQGITTGQAIGYVLDAVGWTGGRDLDGGSTVIPWWWADGSDAYEMLQQLLASEGPPALLTVDITGAIVFRDRQHRLVRAASKTVQATFRGGDTDPEPVMARGYVYDDAWRNIVNSPTFSVDVRQPSSNLVDVWSDNADSTITLAASASTTIVVQASDPFMGAVVPANGPDYTLVSGGVASITLSRTSGLSTSITITATGAGCTITGLQLRAYSVPVARTYQVTPTSAAQTTANTAQSITDYGQRGVASGQEPVWASLQDAQALADLYVVTRAQPLPILTVRFNCSDLDTTRLAAVLALDLSDRVTVIESESAVNLPFFVESIRHTISDVTGHEVVFGLEAVPSVPAANVFVVGTSTLNGADLLGY